jgi:hypothetical protein
MDEFELRVTFTGLCLFLIQEDRTKVAVVQPDCRKGDGAIHPDHPGGGKGRFHIGYIRFELVNLVEGYPVGTQKEGPAYEVVHRFRHEDLSWGLPVDNTPMTIGTGLPAFERIAPDLKSTRGECLLEPIRNRWDNDAPLVMRTVLSGGTLSGSGKTNFYFPKVFNPDMPDYTGSFADEVTWTRTVKAAGLNLCIRPFGAATGTRIPLKPIQDGAQKIISIKVANLCSENPLEWNRFKDPRQPKKDKDFRWLYRVLRPVSGNPIESLLHGMRLPVPTRDKKVSSGVENCIGGTISVKTI